MTTDRKFEILVHSWLKEGGSALSERVAAGVMAELATTAQRRPFPPISRWRSLPAPTRFALASTAAVIVVAAVGAGLLLARPGPNVGPTVPTSPVSPSPSDGSSPSPSREAPSDSPSAASRGTWEAIDGLRITFDLPAGWSQPAGAGSSERYPTPHARGSRPDMAVNFYDDVETVFQDACLRGYREGGESGGTGATPADLAAKLRSATGYSTSEPFEVTLAGFHGKRLALQIPDTVDDCHQTSGIPLWNGRPTGFGSLSQRSTLWILDVDGKRVMIEAVSFPGTSAEDLAAQQQLIDSIRIELVKPAPTVIDSIDGLRITFDVPAGWASNGSGASPTGLASLDADVTFGTVERVWQYPCRMPLLSNKSLAGTTSADLAAKFRSAQGYTSTKPVDVLLAGYAGKRLQLQMPESMADCYVTTSSYMLWIGEPMRFGSPGQRDDLRILDVDGVRLVIDAKSVPGTTAEDRAAQQRLIDSIEIQRLYSDGHPPARPVVRVDAIDGLRITYQLPPNWAHGPKLASLISTDPAAPSVSFGTVDRVPRYPCTTPKFGFGPGPDTTVDQLAAAFDRVTEYDHTSPVGAALAGFSGARIDLTMPSEAAGLDCTGSNLDLWMSGEEVTHGQFDQRHQIWILDVEGVRLVIDATSFPGTSAADMAARQELIDSIRIERTTH